MSNENGISVFADWKCPFCGLEQKTLVALPSQFGRIMHVTYCDVGKSGCDQQVAVSVTMKVEAVVYKLVPAEVQS